jgi:hypothetical protein
MHPAVRGSLRAAQQQWQQQHRSTCNEVSFFWCLHLVPSSFVWLGTGGVYARGQQGGTSMDVSDVTAWMHSGCCVFHALC